PMSKLRLNMMCILRWLGRSRLQFSLKLVQEAPISTLRDELVRVRSNQTALVQPHAEEAQAVLHVVRAPTPVRQRLNHFHPYRVARLVSFGDDVPGSALGLVGADIGGLEDCPNGALGRNRVLLHELPPSTDQTAVVLRPGTILRRVNDDTADLLGA